MADVVLLYNSDCPNVEDARSHLRRAFERAELAPTWRELDIDSPETPAEWRTFGSPTILVDGADVDASSEATGPCCRLYGGSSRAPDVDHIAARLRAASRSVE